MTVGVMTRWRSEVSQQSKPTGQPLTDPPGEERLPPPIRALLVPFSFPHLCFWQHTCFTSRLGGFSALWEENGSQKPSKSRRRGGSNRTKSVRGETSGDEGRDLKERKRSEEATECRLENILHRELFIQQHNLWSFGEGGRDVHPPVLASAEASGAGRGVAVNKDELFI